MTTDEHEAEESYSREEFVELMGGMGEEIAAGLEAMHSVNSGWQSELIKITDLEGDQISLASLQDRPESGLRP